MDTELSLPFFDCVSMRFTFFVNIKCQFSDNGVYSSLFFSKQYIYALSNSNIVCLFLRRSEFQCPILLKYVNEDFLAVHWLRERCFVDIAFSSVLDNSNTGF